MRISDWSSDVCSSDLFNRKDPGYIDNVTTGEKNVNDNHARGGQITALWKATDRSEEHTSELQSLMRISYAVLCLKKKNQEDRQLNHKHRDTHGVHTQPHTNTA